MKKEGGITFTWLTGVLMTILGALITLLINYQNGVNMKAQKSITNLNNESLKQTALLVVIAEKDGIPSTEVEQLLNLPVTNSVTLN